MHRALWLSSVPLVLSSSLAFADAPTKYTSAQDAATHAAAKVITDQVRSDYRYDPSHASVVTAPMVSAKQLSSSKNVGKFLVTTNTGAPVKASVQITVRNARGRWSSAGHRQLTVDDTN